MAKLNYFIHFSLIMLVILLLSAATVTAKTAMGTTVGAAEIENKNGRKLGEKPAFTSSSSPLVFRFLPQEFPNQCHKLECDTKKFSKERCNSYLHCGKCNTKWKCCTYVYPGEPPYEGEEEEVMDGEPPYEGEEEEVVDGKPSSEAEEEEVVEEGKGEGDELYIHGIKVGDEDGEYEIDEEYYQGIEGAGDENEEYENVGE